MEFQTVTIDIINANALKLLQDLELLQLIRVHKEDIAAINTSWPAKYKGAMLKEKLEDIDDQLKELRSGWE